MKSYSGRPQWPAARAVALTACIFAEPSDLMKASSWVLGVHSPGRLPCEEQLWVLHLKGWALHVFLTLLPLVLHLQVLAISLLTGQPGSCLLSASRYFEQLLSLI